MCSLNEISNLAKSKVHASFCLCAHPQMSLSGSLLPLRVLPPPQPRDGLGTTSQPRPWVDNPSQPADCKENRHHRPGLIPRFLSRKKKKDSSIKNYG